MSVKHAPEPVESPPLSSLAQEQPICHVERLAACKKMVYEIAEDLSSVDVRSIQYHYSLPTDSAPSQTLALEVLESFEKKGKFTCYEIGPLEEILKSINRHDLIMKYIVDYKQRYCTGNILRSVSSPPRSLPPRRLPNKLSMPIMNPPAPTPRSGPLVSEHPSSTAEVASLSTTQAQQPLQETTAEAKASRGLHGVPGETKLDRDMDDHQPSADADLSSLGDDGLKMAPIVSSGQATALQEPSQASALSSQPRLQPVAQGTAQLGAEGARDRVLEQSDETWERLESSTCREEAPLVMCHDSWRIKRKAAYGIICAHREGKTIKLGKMSLKLNTRVCPKLLLKFHPCGEGKDRSNYYATLGVEVLVPPKCLSQFDQLRVKLTARVNGRREEISAVSELNGQNFNVYGLISHQDIIRSKSPDIVVHATATVEYYPTEKQQT